jgi:hypothetical protein
VQHLLVLVLKSVSISISVSVTESVCSILWYRYADSYFAKISVSAK